MYSPRIVHVCCAMVQLLSALYRLASSVQHPAADLDRLGRDQHKGDDARYGSPVDPIVDRAALDQHVPDFEMNRRIVEFHIDLARHHHRIIDRVGAMISRARAGSELEDAKNGAVVERRAGRAPPLILAAGVVDRKALGRPNDASGGTRPRRNEVLRYLVDLDDGMPGLVVTGDNPAKLQRHNGPPRLIWFNRSGSIQKLLSNSENSGRPVGCNCASVQSPISPKRSTGSSSSIRVGATCRGS